MKSGPKGFSKKLAISYPSEHVFAELKILNLK